MTGSPPEVRQKRWYNPLSMNERKKIHRFFLNDPLLGEAARIHGLPDLDIYGQGGPLMTLVEAVISQQLADSAARAIFGRLEAYVGSMLKDPASLSGVSKEKLRELGISGNKADTIITIARMTKSGLLDLDGLAGADDGAVREELIKIRGIGEWTVQMYLIFGLKREDVWPATDLGIRKKLSALLKKRKLMDPDEVEAFGRRWEPYRSYAAIHLWRS